MTTALKPASKDTRRIDAQADREYPGYCHIAIGPLVNGRMAKKYDGSIRLTKENLAGFIRMLTAIHAELD